MAKITAVCLRQDRQATVERLCELGSVHVADVRLPASPELTELERRRQQAGQAVQVLEALKTTVATTGGERAPLTPEQLVQEVLRLAGAKAQADEELARLGQQAAQLAPWGSFSLADLANLRRHGLQVVPGVAPRDQLPALPPGAVLHTIRERHGTVYFVAVAEAGCDLKIAPAPLPELTDAAEIERRQAAARGAAEAARAALVHLRSGLPQLKQEIRTTENDIQFARALDGMGVQGELVYLQGYAPQRCIPALEAAARRGGWGLRHTEPEAEDANVPTLLVLPRWVEPIRVVIDGLGILPGYREVDISAWFLLFFSLFFAMLIGDAPYGMLLLVATVVLRRRFPAAPAQAFWLMGILGGATIVWGVLTGTYFGLEPRMLPRVLNRLTVPWLTDATNVQGFCFLIGAIHLTIAHAVNAWLSRRSLKWLGELSWAMVLWGNYYMANLLVLSRPAPAVMSWLYIGGVSGIVLFSEPQRNPFKMVGAGLAKLVLGIVNSFVDLLSYIRLFAVGMAGLTLEQSFLKMATEAGGGHWWAPVVAAAILVTGHLLNIILGSLGVLVHGVRLNVLEFAGHVGLGFTGIRYRPLRRSAKAGT